MASDALTLFAAFGVFVWLVLLASIGVFVDTLDPSERPVIMDRSANMRAHPIMEVLFRIMVALYTLVPMAVLLAVVLEALGM